MIFSYTHKNTSPYLATVKQNVNSNPNPNPSPKPNQTIAVPLFRTFSKKKIQTPPTVVKPVVDPVKLKWGPPLWKFFHTMSIKLKEEYFPLIRDDFLQNILSICSTLPCPVCSQHASEYMKTINFNNIKTKRDLINLFYNFHNAVNERKGYPKFEYANLEYTYANENLIAVCQNFMYHYTDKHRSAKIMVDDFVRTQIANKLKMWINSNIQYFG